MRYYLPSFESDTRVKTNVIKESRIDKRQRKIWHTAQFYATINLKRQFLIINIRQLSLKRTYPCISANTVAPVLSMIASTSSTTSKYASLLVYLTPDLLHGMLES